MHVILKNEKLIQTTVIGGTACFFFFFFFLLLFLFFSASKSSRDKDQNFWNRDIHVLRWQNKEYTPEWLRWVSFLTTIFTSTCVTQLISSNRFTAQFVPQYPE